MFRWTEKSIELWQRAEKYTDHYVELGNSLKKFIKADHSVYDIGCGLGFVDLELAPYVKNIKAFDIEQRVLDILNKNAVNKNINNLEICNNDWTKESDNSCDTLMACSFGNIVECFDDFMRIAKDQVILVKRYRSKDKKKYVPGRRAFSAEATEAYLRDRNIVYDKYIFESEFGQPLVSYEEAVWFSEFHGMNRSVPVEDFLKENLITVKDSEYKYYLPNKKEMVIFIIKTDQYRGADNEEGK